MILKDLLNLQQIVEKRAIPYDVLEFDSKHYSQSKDMTVDILDLHLTHAIRILNNYLTVFEFRERQDIDDSLKSIRDLVDNISDVVNKWPW